MPSLTKLVVSTCAVTLSLFAVAGIASAAPDISQIVNTNCSYRQVIAALNAQSPELAAEFTASPAATSWLRQLVASGPDQRQVMLEQVQGLPGIDQYSGVINSVAGSCTNY